MLLVTPVPQSLDLSGRGNGFLVCLCVLPAMQPAQLVEGAKESHAATALRGVEFINMQVGYQ